ncbi:MULTISPECIES: MipA/OmpV family protein [Serratia]|uniref:MipA/OmpV family protein n=1 Tax=Serratia TaxID=613 RepID=UPI00217B547C|nr:MULTISPECIES: MipA/OmpV family protein [Serratia]CAI1004307.1 MltA-interacting protein MipA [Serratia quinivorans]CAI1090278.1 MltA-interacting protein MipA [Serratia quinivorans]CAI2121562.1 MltA-interacting protein MipA [Serratia quinivorans]CAI2488454.1 MltA-interacting protein MipA [Serratia liquefaciens]
MKENKPNRAIPGVLLATSLLAGAAVPCAQAAAPVDTAEGEMAASQHAAAPAAPERSLSIGGGVAVLPLYEGSSRYAAFPSYALRGVLPTERWGTFTATLPEGLRWDLPIHGRVGIALLGGYDAGRKEKISTLGGNDHYLAGMGDLDSTPMIGAEVYLRLPTGRLFVRGMQSTRERRYGGDNLGHTTYLDAGVMDTRPVSQLLTINTAFYATWSDDHDMMARFGVTRQQSEHSDFREYHAGGGLRDVTLKTAATLQMSPHVALEGGFKVYALVSGARHSPLTDDTVGAGVFLNALYRF